MKHAARASLILTAFLLGPLAGCAARKTSPYIIHWGEETASGGVEVAGIGQETLQKISGESRTPTQWAALLSVHVETAPGEGEDLPPMAGAWSVRDGRLCFQPQFPFADRVRYRAEFHPEKLPVAGEGEPVISYFLKPAPPAGPPVFVAQIFPSADVLPENQLKFYVHFSAPMSRGEIYRHIHLRDTAGREADLPFLDIDEELWDPAMTRVTLLIDPGRIKRGVKPLEDLGPVFEEGKSYSLTIDAAWHDAAGRPLRETHRKDFRIGPADRTPPDPARWTVRPPAAGTREPLTVVFDEPMDRALALRLITVAGTGGESVPGETDLAGQERNWSFIPAQPWRAGTHKLVVGTTIEDLAGNNIGKVFDVDVFENVQRGLAAEAVLVPFEVK